MLSSLGYAILALVATKPQTGYDIARQMKSPLGFLWQAKHGQIYPELARLVELGLVDFERHDAQSGPPRRVHSITSAGRGELSRWVAQPPSPRPMNDELVVKAFALRRIRPDERDRLLRDQIQLHEQRLGVLENLGHAIEIRESGAPSPDSARFGEYAALRRAIGAERDYIAWCRWLVQQLSVSEGSNTERPRTRPRVRQSPVRQTH